ncbi:peptide/nickel transport system permease protein [Hoeflea marina]|uniref:Peptide/nickel transport system permease protein n=1 Tax=Hoeflea marina TaxID=274592 RepID=A0A317PHI0_9HYPH|nr:ABC transporter permease [Hoeflea marina]PWV98840.1 peptide/nickel transport system permease protein [Hoeflea marina]
MSFLHSVRDIFRGRAMGTAGLIWLCVILFAALAAPWIAPFDPLDIDPVNRLTEPGWPHLFGTDHYGRDTFSRCIYGARMTMLIGLGSVAFALVTGGAVGMLSAYFTRLGNFLMRGIDVLMAFPALLLALVLMTLLERSVVNTIIVIGIVYATTTARILFGMTLKLKREVFIDAAVCSGAGHGSILFRHILPNLISPLLVQASFIFAFAQLQAAALDFLGLGLPPEVPSWGNMLSESRIYVTRAPWLLLYPGLLIILSVFSMNMVGDAMRDSMDPRFKDDIAGV